MKSRGIIAVVIVAALVWGCGSNESSGDASSREGEEESSGTSGEYQVVFANAITDTLRGEAGFGVVFESDTGAERFVIRLASDFDFAGGIVLARGDTTRPASGDYDLHLETDSAAAPNRFLMLYREGILRDMRAVSGSLTLTTVTDTLIVGRFDARLRGRVANLDQSAGAEVHAVGRFRAEPELDGFVIGL